MSCLNYNVAELIRRLSNVLREGKIEEADYEAAKVKVRFSDDLVSGWLRWISGRALEEVVWDAPEVGEQVLVLSPNGDLASGIVLPGLFSDAGLAPSANPDITRREHKDGAIEQYDRAAHRKTIELPDDGELLITIGSTIITAKNGSVEIDAASILLGPPGDRKAVARVGDKVNISAGSSIGLNGVIYEGSSVVSAS
jgi:phage baseplate assembly protein V